MGVGSPVNGCRGGWRDLKNKKENKDKKDVKDRKDLKDSRGGSAFRPTSFVHAVLFVLGVLLVLAVLSVLLRFSYCAAENVWQLLQSSFLSVTCFSWTFRNSSLADHSSDSSPWQLAQSGFPLFVLFGV